MVKNSSQHLAPVSSPPSSCFAGCHKGPQDGVVATVNGHPILQTDVDKIYTQQLASNPQQQSPSARSADRSSSTSSTS
jgi:hypothetical protein